LKKLRPAHWRCLSLGQQTVIRAGFSVMYAHALGSRGIGRAGLSQLGYNATNNATSRATTRRLLLG